MKTATVKDRVVASASVPRRPSKPKPGEQVHISFYEDGSIVGDIDREAERLTNEDPHGRRFTRTDAVRSLLRSALNARKK